jgi:hypothetical protein
MAVAFIAQRKRLVRRFKSVGATSATTAIEPGAHGIGKGWIFGKLVRDGSIKGAGGDRYYLDEERENLLFVRRRKIAVAIIIIVMLALAVVFGVFR